MTFCDELLAFWAKELTECMSYKGIVMITKGRWAKRYIFGTHRTELVKDSRHLHSQENDDIDVLSAWPI